ncbi:MAG: putative bifunctional diguanylate cyclase/phosphodiesterase [Hyphomicrobiales bacterium]
MRFPHRPGLRFVLLIVLPFTLSALGILWTTVNMLNGISTGANTQDNERTRQLVRSAFKSAEQRLSSIMTYNAHWDNAVRNSYGLIDDEWMYDTWGAGTEDVNYDAMFIVEKDGRPVTAYRKGHKLDTGAADHVGAALPRVLADLPRDSTTFEAVTTLVNTPDGVAVLAAGPILPASEDIIIPLPQPRVLILVQVLTPEILARMGEQYIVDGLSLAAAEPAGGSHLVLRNRWGDAVTGIKWQDRRLGDAALRSYGTGAFVTLFALVGVMVLISVIHFRVMQRLAARERMAVFAAHHDALSGLPNRQAIAEEIAKMLPAAKTLPLALMYIDLDGFKNVNDTYDHETGDKLICAISSGFLGIVGERGILARLGGDEFAALITGEDSAIVAETIARDMLAFAGRPFDIDGRIASVGASIGIVHVHDEEGMEAAEVMRRADVAMYTSKEQGRHRCCLFDKELDRARIADMVIANELREHVRRGRIGVAYQPIVDSRTRTVIGVEALARWPTDDSRQVPPGKFIRLAEEQGIINVLGESVLAIACRDAAQWRDIRLSINVSPVQLNNPDFVRDVRRVTAQCGLPLERLELEITESFLIHNPGRAKEVIDELRTSGISVSLDDFGTGFSSVGYLRQFAFDKVKLDRSLTNSIVRDAATQRVVQGTVLIATGLSLEITAEGIETEEEAQLLRLSGCNQLQGFYFGRPQSSRGITSLLATGGEHIKPVSRRAAGRDRARRQPRPR